MWNVALETWNPNYLPINAVVPKTQTKNAYKCTVRLALVIESILWRHFITSPTYAYQTLLLAQLYGHDFGFV